MYDFDFRGQWIRDGHIHIGRPSVRKNWGWLRRHRHLVFHVGRDKPHQPIG